MCIRDRSTTSGPENETSAQFQKKYDVFVNAIPDGLILIKDGTISYANRSFSNLLGYSVDEICTLELKKIISPKFTKEVLDRYERRLRGEFVPTQYEIELLHKDGKTTIPVALSVGLVGSAKDKLEFVIVKDLSEKIEIESRFERELQLQKYFMDYIPDSIYFKDLESRFIKANKATLLKMGFNSIDELLGKTDFDIFHDEHAKLAKQDEEDIINNRTSIVNKIEKETWLDGKITWASTTKVPLIDENDNVYGTFGITRNITDLKKAEDIKDALFKISTAVTTLNNINDLYEFIHKTISELMRAENFYIAIYHKETETVSFPYFVDQVDEPPAERKAGKGLTEFVLRTGKAQLITCLLYTSPSPRDRTRSRMPSSAWKKKKKQKTKQKKKKTTENKTLQQHKYRKATHELTASALQAPESERLARDT